jgi:hypothetical protein
VALPPALLRALEAVWQQCGRCRSNRVWAKAMILLAELIRLRRGRAGKPTYDGSAASA